MIDINSLTVGQLKEISALVNLGKKTSSTSHPYKIGQNYFIRTVTYFFTGKLIEVFDDEIVIEDAAWIPDTGRYSDSFKTGKHAEVEPLEGRIIIGRQAIIDCAEWNKDLPRKQI